MAHKVDGCYGELVQELRASPAVFADETSWWVGGAGWWLWTFTTPRSTLYCVEASRGSAVVEQVLGPKSPGRLVSDCLASYDPAPYAKHKCLAHHLRAIKELEQTCQDPAYLQEWKGFFHGVIALYYMRQELGAERFVQMRQNLERQADALLGQVRSQPED